MSQVTVGQDIGVFLIAIGLIVGFTLVLMDSYSEFTEVRSSEEEKRLLFYVFDLLRNRSVSGVITENVFLENESGVIERLNKEGHEIELKVRSQKGKEYRRAGKIDGSKIRTISLPIVYESADGRVPARIIISIGAG